MTRGTVLTLAALFASTLANPAAAAVTSVDGTVSWIFQPVAGYAMNTFIFSLVNQPTNSCQSGGYLQFVISPGSITDTPTRERMFALLLTAKATGAQIRVGYDNAGALCDQGSLAVERLVIL